MTKKIALLGATTLVGREILNIWAERGMNPDSVLPVGSEKKSGAEVSMGDSVLRVQAAEVVDLTDVSVAVLVALPKQSATFAARARAEGLRVIDASGHFALHPDVPLVVPDLGAAIEGAPIIALPGSLTTQLALALAPLARAVPITRVVVSTYQAVSAQGRKAMDELFNQTRDIFMNKTPEGSELPKRIAFNAIPQSGDFMDDRATTDEWRVVAEAKKILGADVKIVVQAVTIPVFTGHGMMVNVEFGGEMDAKTARSLWLKSRGVTLIDLETDLGYVTPADVQGEDTIYISRSRDDSTIENGLSFWCVGDNIRATAALQVVKVLDALS